MTIYELEAALKQTKTEEPTTHQGKLQLLERLVKISKDALQEAIRYADANALTFQFSDEYGDRRQTYRGKGTTKQRWQHSGCSDSYGDEYLTEGEWTSSSDDC